MDTQFHFEEVKKKLEQSRRELFILLPNQAQNYFTSSFKKQGFDGKAWKEVQRRELGTKAYEYPKTKGLQRRTSPILVGAGYRVRGGTLRRAVSSMARTVTSNGDTFKMIIDLPYAEIQNNGGVINKGASDRIIQFKVDKKTGKSRFSTKKKSNFEQDVHIGAHSITIPQRQFVGQTQELTDMQKKKIEQIINRIWKIR